MHKVCTGKVGFRDSFDISFILFLAKWTAVHNLVPFTLTLSLAIRVGLVLSCMTCIFNKERLGSI